MKRTSATTNGKKNGSIAAKSTNIIGVKTNLSLAYLLFWYFGFSLQTMIRPAYSKVKIMTEKTSNGVNRYPYSSKTDSSVSIITKRTFTDIRVIMKI